MERFQKGPLPAITMSHHKSNIPGRLVCSSPSNARYSFEGLSSVMRSLPVMTLEARSERTSWKLRKGKISVKFFGCILAAGFAIYSYLDLYLFLYPYLFLYLCLYIWSTSVIIRVYIYTYGVFVCLESGSRLRLILTWEVLGP